MTAVSQPLDVGPNSALESKIKSISHRWHGANAGGKLDQYSMMKHVVFHAVEQVFSNPNTVISAFRRTGLVPWRKLDPQLLKKLAPGTIFKHHHHAEIFPDPGPSSDLSPQLGNVVEAAPTPQLVTETVGDPDPEPVPISAPVSAPESAPESAPVPSVAVPDTASDSASVAVSDDSPPLSLSLPSSSTVSTPAMSREASASSAVCTVSEASASSTASVPSSSSSNDPSFDLLVAEQRDISQEQRDWLLQRHELLLGPPRVRLFEDLYSKNLLHCPNTEFQCWLLLKKQAVGTEAEALERVISSRQPKNVPKKKTTRKMDLPTGGDRYDPLSKGFDAYFERVAARKSKRTVSAPDSLPELIAPAPAKVAKKVKKTKK